MSGSSCYSVLKHVRHAEQEKEHMFWRGFCCFAEQHGVRDGVVLEHRAGDVALLLWLAVWSV